ncbi:ABC transporter ATP-binding protein [Pseudonocardia sp. TRM90224]|uniref:ABC transporter ATP-binding protein n=1 Tax=Pseudonocardia sp. TRM90224 TaxID=2812678 RepID=UPI001E5F7E2E|nr:ABC transporter ATP-binding protein [Pseudonocardia sp. TRM90224]
MTPLLDITDLSIRFRTDDGELRAVDGVSLQVAEGEVLGVVGESGSGKSVTALTVMGLLAGDAAVTGQVRYRGADLLTMDPTKRRALCGPELAMVYQDSMAVLNPTMTVGRQIAMVVRHHRGGTKKAAMERAAEMLDLVGIPDVRARVADYPHQFSGGQRQRILIALALCCEPRLLIADEPTTALDVTVQAQIVELVRKLRSELGMAVVWVTHDLGVLAGLADSVAVMYAGRVVERGPVDTIYAGPRHPYTEGLLRSLPRLDAAGERLTAIPGGLPDLTQPIPGCAFSPRCGWSTEHCTEERPDLHEIETLHASACFRAAELPAGLPADPDEPAVRPVEVMHR